MLKVNPEVLRQVIEYLQAKYPNELPRTVTTIESLHMKIGEQHVIESLNELLEYSNG